MAAKLLHSIDLVDACTGESIAAGDERRRKVTFLAMAPFWMPMPLRQTMASLYQIIDGIQEQGNAVALVYLPVDRDEDFIAKFKATHAGNAKVIDDRSPRECVDDLLKQLPEGWMAVPLEASAARESLLKDLKTREMFDLAVIGEEGEVLATRGMELMFKWGPLGFPYSDERIEAVQKEIEDRKAKQSLKSLLVSPDRDFVIRNDGSQIKIETLEGKIVALYFSAHWCGPCRNFTPMLANFYKQLRAKFDDGFEVVFISSDKDQAAFDDYFKEMPWLAVPFSDSKIRQELDRHFDVAGIPTLVVLDKDGKTISADAVQLLSKYGVAAYPFTAEKLEQIKAEEAEKRAHQTLESVLVSDTRDFVVAKDGKQVKISELKGKTIGLYFSAHWCPPCRGFTPTLAEVYTEIKNNNADFEIIFISSDRDEESFKSYFASMPWLALPYSDRGSKADLSAYFEVQGIPTLVILGPDGKTVSAAGRNLVSTYKAAAFPFTKPHIDALEAEKIEAANAAAAKLPKEIKHSSHPEHPLMLVSNPYDGPFGCDVCDDDGTGWVYHCAECSFDIHPECAKVETEHADDEKKEGWVCEGDACRKI